MWIGQGAQSRTFQLRWFGQLIRISPGYLLDPGSTSVSPRPPVVVAKEREVWVPLLRLLLRWTSIRAAENGWMEKATSHINKQLGGCDGNRTFLVKISCFFFKHYFLHLSASHLFTFPETILFPPKLKLEIFCLLG